MNDQRWEQLAHILVNYSTRLQPNDKLLIVMVETETLPLVRAVHSAAVRAGALPHVEFQSAYLERDLMRYGSQEQLDWVPEMQTAGIEWSDAYIGLRGARNPHEFTGIPPERIAAHRRAIGKISALRAEMQRWVLVRVPNEALAQQAGMSLDEMMDFFFGATLRDWGAESKRYAELKKVFDAAENVRIVGNDTELCFSTRGRSYVIGDGQHNMPDGEIFTAPVDASAEGRISFEFPGVYAGQFIEGICLEFASGRVLKATARTNERLLHEILNMDAGSQRLGEFGVGTNFGIARFCGDILYDEKIGGTIHLALGRAYAECGGVNQSALHWDIIKNLREEGSIYLNDEKVFEKGKFLV